jgi:hypothetical protein
MNIFKSIHDFDEVTTDAFLLSIDVLCQWLLVNVELIETRNGSRAIWQVWTHMSDCTVVPNSNKDLSLTWAQGFRNASRQIVIAQLMNPFSFFLIPLQVEWSTHSFTLTYWKGCSMCGSPACIVAREKYYRTPESKLTRTLILKLARHG